MYIGPDFFDYHRQLLFIEQTRGAVSVKIWVIQQPDFTIRAWRKNNRRQLAEPNFGPQINPKPLKVFVCGSVFIFVSS